MKALIEKLRKHIADISLTQIVALSPFDAQNNVAGLITKGDYFSHIHCASPLLEDVCQKISNELTDRAAPRKVAIICGYAGTGKTTAVHHFIRKFPQCAHQYIDVNDPATTSIGRRLTPADEAAILQKATKAKSFAQLASCMSVLAANDTPIASLLRSTMQDVQRLDGIRAVVGRLKTIENSLPRLVDPQFARLVRSIGSNATNDQISEFVSACPSSAIFALFFLTTMQDLPGHRPLFVYFDNLDKAELDYLAHRFLADFCRAHETVAALLECLGSTSTALEFFAQVKFIFCLREVTFSAMDVHSHSNFRQMCCVKHVDHFAVPEFYQEIAQKRLEFAREVFAGDVGTASAISCAKQYVEIFMSASDFGERSANTALPHEFAATREVRYFETAIAPLYNFDLKKLLPVIVEASRSGCPGDGHTMRAGSEEVAGVFRHALSYGRGAHLMHTVCTSLRRDDFTRTILADRATRRRRETGYCSCSRMILTACLNRCRYDHISHRMRDQSKSTMSALADSLAGIYSPREVAEKVEDLYLAHTRDWAPLLLIDGCRSARDGHLLLPRFRHDIDDVATTMTANGEHEASLPLDLREYWDHVTIAITPAGFAFLKYLLVHFEYYGCEAGNDRSLFAYGSDRSAYGDYLFEGALASVHALVSRHVKEMNRFYESAVRDRMGIDPHAYRRSVLSFRHLGGAYDPPREEGHFFAFRLINGLISYLDRFRSFLLASDLSADEKPRVNKILADWIMNYASLNAFCADPSSARLASSYADRMKNLSETNYSEPHFGLFGQ